jgi:hypothetical protein
LLLAGCGLQDYESRTAYEQKRIKYYDEENEQLEPNPITLPEPKEKEGQVIAKGSLFFRPPKGVSTTPNETSQGMFYRYAGSRNAGFDELLVAPLMTTKGADKIKEALLQEVGMSEMVPMHKEMGARSGHPISFEYYHNTASATAPYLYIQGSDPLMVAILFRPAEKQSADRLETLMDYSLGSLLMGIPATQKYRTWKPLAPRTPATNPPSRP